jgi:hypothetical protein
MIPRPIMKRTYKSEQGGARLKFLVVMAIIVIGAYCAYQFIPLAYRSYQLKDLMQNDVDTAAATGKPASWVQEQLVKSSQEYGIPTNAVITPLQEDNRVQIRVQFTQPVEFPGFVYDYEFDHTARSSTFLSVK